MRLNKILCGLIGSFMLLGVTGYAQADKIGDTNTTIGTLTAQAGKNKGTDTIASLTAELKTHGIDISDKTAWGWLDKMSAKEKLAALQELRDGFKKRENSPKVMTEAERQEEAKQAAFRKKRQDWFGHSVDDLILKWGTPSSVHKRQDGGSQYTWKRRQDNVWGTNYTICTDNFVTNSKGTLKNWTTSGCYW